MQKILLINPYEPPSKRKAAAKRKVKPVNTGVKKMAAAKRKRRTPAQIAATKRLVAANKARRTTKVKRKKNPVAPSKAAAYRGVPTLKANPVKRRRKSTTTRTVSSTAGRKFGLRRRKNPIGSPLKTGIDIFKNSIGSSLWGAGGAVAVDVAAGFIPVPDMLKTGYPKYLFKGLLSGLAGVAAGYVVDKKTASDIAAGGLTVNLYGALTEFVKANVPGVALGYYNAALPASRKNLGAYVSGANTTKGAGSSLQASAPGNSLGAYVSGSNRGGNGRNVRAIR